MERVEVVSYAPMEERCQLIEEYIRLNKKYRGLRILTPESLESAKAELDNWKERAIKHLKT